MSIKQEWTRIRDSENGWANDWPAVDSSLVTNDSQNLSIVSSQPLYSNTSNYSPIFLYCPVLEPTVDSYRDIKDIDRLWFVAKENLGGYQNMPILWRMENASQKFSSHRFRSRGGTGTIMSIRFMYCLIRELRRSIVSDLNSPSEPSRIAWIAVVPSEYSVKFHKDFISRKAIDPDKYGIEFWYNPEVISINGQLKKLFSTSIKEQIGKLGLRAIRKTDEEMNSLLTLMPSFIPSHRTPKEAKEWCKGVFNGVISGGSSPIIHPGHQEGVEVAEREQQELASEMLRITSEGGGLMENMRAERPGRGILEQIQDGDIQPITLNMGTEGHRQFQATMGAMLQAMDQLNGLPAVERVNPRPNNYVAGIDALDDIF